MNPSLSLVSTHPRLPVQLHRGCRPGELHLLALAVPVTPEDLIDVAKWLARHGLVDQHNGKQGTEGDT